MAGSTATPSGEGSAGPNRQSGPGSNRAPGAEPAPGAPASSAGASPAPGAGPAPESSAPARGPAAPGRSAGRDSTGRPAAGAPGPGRVRRNGLYWLLPLFAFVLGLVIGGVVIAAADLGSSDQPAAATPTPGAVPGDTDAGSGATTITVPAACSDGLDRADTAAQAARDGLAGIGQLDPSTVRKALERLQTLQPQIRDLAEKCRVGVSTDN